MVGSIFQDGKAVGTFTISDDAYAATSVESKRMEVRNEDGTPLLSFKVERRVMPDEPLVPWDLELTREEIERRMKEPSYTFEEVKEMLGWKSHGTYAGPSPRFGN